MTERGRQGKVPEPSESYWSEVGSYARRNWALPAIMLLLWLNRRFGFENVIADVAFAAGCGLILTFGWRQLAFDAGSKLRWGLFAIAIVFVLAMPLGALLVLLLVPYFLFDLFFLARRGR